MNWIVFFTVSFLGCVSADGNDGIGVAMQIHKYMPRVYGPGFNAAALTASLSTNVATNGTTNGTTDSIVSLLIGTAALSGFGLLILLVSLVWGSCFCGCRYCCNACGGRQPRLRGYSPWHVQRVGTVVSICAVLLVGALTTMWVYSTYLHLDLTNTDRSHLWGQVNGTVDDLLSTVGAANQTLLGLPNQTIGALDFIDMNTQQLSLISIESNQLLTTIELIASQIVNGKTFSTSNATFICTTTCASVHSQLSSTISSIQSYQSSLGPALDRLQTIKSNLLSGQSKLTNATVDQSDMLTNVYLAVDSAWSTATDYKQQNVDSWETTRYILVIVLALLPIIGVLFALYGARAKSGICFCSTAVTSWITLTVLAVFLAVMLPLTAIVSDGCLALDYVEHNLSNVTSLSNELNSCLTNSSLAYPLNVTGQIKDIGFSADTNMSVYVTELDTTSLSISMVSVQTSIGSLNLASFGLNDTLIDVNIAQLNAICQQYLVPPISYNRSTLSSVDDATPGANATQHNDVIKYKYAALQLMDGEILINDFLQHVTINATVAQSLYMALARSAITTQTTLSLIPSLVQEMFQGLEQILIDTMWCGWLNNDYQTAKSMTCNQLMLHLGLLTLATFISIVLLAPLTIGAVMLAKRINAIDVLATEPDDIQMPRLYRPNYSRTPHIQINLAQV